MELILNNIFYFIVKHPIIVMLSIMLVILSLLILLISYSVNNNKNFDDTVIAKFSLIFTGIIIFCAIFIAGIHRSFELVDKPTNKEFFYKNGLYLQKKPEIEEEKATVYVLKIGKGLFAKSYTSLSKIEVKQENGVYKAKYEEEKEKFSEIEFTSDYIITEQEKNIFIEEKQ